MNEARYGQARNKTGANFLCQRIAHFTSALHIFICRARFVFRSRDTARRRCSTSRVYSSGIRVRSQNEHRYSEGSLLARLFSCAFGYEARLRSSASGGPFEPLAVGEAELANEGTRARVSAWGDAILRPGNGCAENFASLPSPHSKAYWFKKSSSLKLTRRRPCIVVIHSSPGLCSNTWG